MTLLRASFVPFAVASAAGYLCWAGTLLLYDASGGLGPLAAIGGWPVLRVGEVFFYNLLGPTVYAVATWRFKARGALIALVGVGLVAPALWSISPWSHVDPGARFGGVYDEGRSWIAFGLLIFGIGWFFVVPPLTYVARWVWRRRHRNPPAGARID
jgi:hypothetical protein